MLSLSATCVAIALADKRGDLRLVERVGRFGPFVALEYSDGVIEVASDMAEAEQRVAALRERAA